MKIPVWVGPRWRETILILIVLTPWLSLVVFGLLWLHDHGALLPWLAGSALFGLAVWPVRRSLKRRLQAGLQEELRRLSKPSPEWTEQGRAALDKVKSLASTAPSASFADVAPFRDLAIQTVRVVAGHFRPGVAQPELDITLPELLLLAERATHDMRDFVLRTVPGSRSITLRYLFGAKTTANAYGPMAYGAYTALNVAYNVFLVFTNPAAGMARVVKSVTSGQAIELLIGNARAYGTRLFVLEVGRTAIDLYSGRLRLSEAELAAAAASETPALPVQMALPRLLFVGQINAGKSSLVNALAQDVLCEVQSIPTAVGTVEHHLSVEGKDCAIIVDMPGLTLASESQDALATAAAGCDMIIWAASATQPGRAADVAALTRLRAAHAADLGVRIPPVVVVLTHVDQLSPKAEWAPPYDVVEPRRRKEVAMRQAIETVAESLSVPASSVVPVAMPRGGEAWNSEFLWGCISTQLHEAKYRQLERLRLKHGGSSWRELADQAGGFLARLGTATISGNV